MSENNLLSGAQNFLGMPSGTIQPQTPDAPRFRPGTDDFTDEEQARRRAGMQAATQVLFRTDISKLDDDAVGGLYRASAKALFGIEDPDGTVAFGRKRAGDARHNVELLRQFCKGDYSLIRDPEYDSWRAMDEEQKFRHALENESKSAKVKGNLEGKRGASLWEMLALSGTSGAPGNQLPQETREDIQRRMDYDRLTPEEQEVYRKDVIGRYDRKIAKEQVLATYLAAKEGMSDRAAEMLANSYSRGEVDVDAVEALSDEDKDRFYTALSVMRGDQKKGHLLGIPTDFTDDTAVNRGQLALYGLQQSVLGLVSDTWEVGSSAAKWAYAKTLMDDQARNDYFRRWNAEARAKTALEQGLPEADTWMGEMVQALGENSHWFIPYAGIAKGGKMAREAAGTAGALLKSARAAKGAADLEKGMVNLWARQFASMERFTDALRDGAKAAGAVKGKMAGGAAMWTAGEASAFSAFANEYISNCDAAGVSREESVPMSAIVGLVNAKIESLYVPGLESTLTPAQVKNLMMMSGLRALKSDGAAGFRRWLGNYVEKGLVEGAKVTLTEGAVEEPLQQFVQEWGKEIAQSAEELKKSGRGELGLALGKFVYDNFAADGGFERFAQRNLETYVETAVDMIPSSVGFGLTTNGRQKLAQHRRNRAVRKMNMARWRADVAAAEAEGREAPPAPLMLGLDEQNRMTFNPYGVDYDVGVVDLVQREIDTRRLVGDYWKGKGETEAGPGEDNRYVQAMTEARRIWRSGQGDKVNRIAEAAGVDHTTAEVIAQYLQTEQETAAFSPRVREYVGLAVSAADFSEETIRTVLPGYVDGSFMADDANGVYTAKVKLGDGSERTIAYKVGDLSDELKKMIPENERPDSEFGRSYDAQLRRGSDKDATPWAQLSDAERHKIATDAALGTYGMTEGSGGVFQMTDAKGNAVTVNADEIVRLSNGKLADIGYTALATIGTARHETFHALWRFAAASYTDEQLQEMAKALGLDVTADTWKEDLDEEMAHQMEEYASGHYVSHIAETRIEKLLDSGAGWFVRMFGKLGLGDEVKNAKTGTSFTLKDFYDAVLKGEIGSGELGVRHTATEAAAPKAEKGKTAKSGVPVAVTDEERAQEAQDQAQAAASAQPAEDEQRPEEAAPAAPRAEYTLDNPADATVPDARFYRVQAGDGVYIVGELVVSDANELKTSYKGTLEDGTLQNRAETEEGRALVEKIAGNPDPLQVGTVQPRANNGFIWATPSGNVFIGNTRETGITHAYMRGNAENVRAYMLNEAKKRGLEIPEGVENPIVHFVLRDIQSKDGTAGIQDVVRLTNESVNRGMNVYEQAKNDADVMLKEKLVPGIELRADGLIDTERSAAAIGAFRRLTNAQGMIDADTGLLTEEGQTRLSNAVLAAFLASEDPTLTQKVIRDAGRLDMENERRALMRSAADLMALAEQKPQYDLRGPIAEALRYFTEWREADEAKRAEAGKTRRDWYARTKDGQRRRGIAWQEHMAQQDMFRRPSPAALIIGDLLAASRDLRSFEADDRETEAGKTRAQELVSRYLADFAQNARSANTETDDLFGAPPATVEEMLKAQRTKDGQRRFSVCVIGGRSVAVAETEPLTTKEAKDEQKVREIISRVIGQSFDQVGEAVPVKVDAKFADEFWGSTTSRKLRDKLDKLWRAKVSAIPILKDIVGNTPLGPSEAAKHINARFKKRVKFYRCPSEFGIKRHDGVAIYKCELLVLEMDSGTRYVYDLVKMTKPTLTAKSSLDGDLVQRLYGQTNLTGESATKVPEGTAQSVPPSAGNVNGENFKRWFAGSKIVDADGKPLVVYRGASFDPLAKEPGKGVIMPGAYFTADPEYAKRYGKVNAYYLNISNPLDVRNPAHAADLAKLLPQGYKFATGPMGALDLGEMASFDTEDLKEMGYDGIILDEGADYQSDGTLKNRGISYVPFDGGTQVKSATDNNGDYSLENRDVRFSIANLYTGSSADYEKPSLQYIGTGEGSQVYGWGLYASNQRGVAETYARLDQRAKIGEKHKVEVLRNGKPFKDDDAKFGKLIRKAMEWGEGDYRKSFEFLDILRENFESFKSTGELRKLGANSLEDIEETVQFIKERGGEFSANVETSHEHIYEQTFFTNRAPGDESHLLSWYEPVSEENAKRITDGFQNGMVARRPIPYVERRIRDIKRAKNGGEAYQIIEKALGSPKAASEFLARADIDGIKYPVDSYGGKTVKDGDTAGWNYVSFRDDNIRVDHKWVDGQRRFSVGAINAARDFAEGRDSSLNNGTYGRIEYGFGVPGRITESGKVKGGHGLLHVIFARMTKDGASLEDAVDTAMRVGDAIETGDEARIVANKHYIRKGEIEGIFADNGDGKLVLTGYKLFADGETGAILVPEHLRTTPPPRKEEVVAAIKSWLENQTAAQSVPPSAGDVNGKRFSISNLFTGSSADYEKPSLQYIGTGEGNQVYGWGLYASNQRGVAEGYAAGTQSDHTVVMVNGREWSPGPNAPRYEKIAWEQLDDLSNDVNDIADYCEMVANERDDQDYAKAAEWIRGNSVEIREPHAYVYEQTFFTNREPGDESHLLSWYEPVSEENLERILEGLKKEGVSDRFKDMYWLRYKGMSSYLESNDIKGALLDNGSTGDAVYHQLTYIIGSPKEASEFLARADIDGVKYPVDSYGGKQVKDGETAGWNYVSFRDDNIRVDHKWVDGQKRFSFVSATTKDEFAHDPLTARWTIFAEPSAIRRMPSTPVQDLPPVTSSTDNNSVEKAIQNAFADFGEVVNRNDGYHVVFNRSDAGKMMMQSGVDMRTFAPQMKHLFETSVHAFDNPQEHIPGHKYRKNVVGFRHYINKVMMKDGGEFFVRFTFREETGGRNGVHLATVSDVKIYNEKNAGMSVSANKSEGARVFVDRIIARYLSKGNGLNKMFSVALQDALDRREVTSAEGGAKPKAKARRTPRTARRMSYAFPRLDQMSGDQLVATAVATQMALGKSDKVSDRSVKITTVQKLIKGIHPEWSTHQVGVEALRVATEAQKLARKIREDLDRGVSDSLVLQHLPDAVREQFGQEMTQQARQGARLGAYHQRAMSAVEDKQAKVIEEAVKVQSGIETKLLENAYGVDLSQTLMNLVANPFLKKDANGLYVPAGGGEQAAQDQGEIVQADAPEKEVSDKARRAVDEVVAKSAEARAAEKANEKESERMRGRDQENASGSGGEEDASLEGADIVDIATRKQGLNLEDPRQLAHFVAELARRYWVDTHGLAKDANAWADSVAVQFLRKTAANVYGKLAQEIAYSQARDVAARSIDGFGNIPTVQGLISEMTYVGQVINARKIRETQQQLCERLDLFLREKMGAQGRFKPDNEELHRKVSAEIELRARYMRHAMWLTPDAASEEAKELQRQMDAATVDFKGEGHDAEQARVMVENLRKLNVLREFGSLRYKPVAQIEAAIQYWEDLERGSGDDIARENLDREIRTKKAAAMLAKAFHNPSRKYAREGKGVGDMLSDYLSSHMGFMNLLRDMTRYASKEDAAEAETIFRYLELEIQKAGTKTEVEKRRHAEALASAVNSIYGRDFAKVLKEFAQKDDRFAPFMGAVDGHPVPPTKGRAIQLMVSLLQEGRKIEVEDPEHPGEFIIQWEGGYHDNIVKHGREKQAAEIAKLLTPADMNLVKWLGQWYEANRQELSQVCDSLFGIGVYAETSNYFPVKMLLEKQGLEKGEAVGWSIFPRALTPRVRNERDFDTSADVLQMFMSRMEEAAQWKAHAQLGLELRGIFGRSELQAAITSNHGNKVNQTVLGFVTDTLSGKGTVDRGDNGATYYTDMVRGWAALGALGANFGVMFKQTTSIPAFGFEIGLRKTASHIATAFTPEGMAAMRKIFDSDQRKVRWNTGNTEAVKNALANSGNGPFMRLWKASMFTNRLGDCVPALVVGQGIYREALENGMSEEDAMAYTWMLVERTQQSGRIENQAQFQRRSKFGRAIYQFLSTQQQYLQYEVRALRGVVAKPGDLGKWGDLARAAVLNHFILSSAYFWMGALFKRALGQEPPEDELKDWVVSMLIGPYGALYGLGFTCTGALNEWIKGPQYGGSTSSLPSLSFVGNVIVRDPAAIVKSAFDETKTWDDVLEKMGRFGADANALFRDLRKLKKNYWDD